MSAPTSINRRRFERFTLRPMYSQMALRTLDREVFDFTGHALDVSEGGLRFELDRGIAPGTPVALQIWLPSGGDPRMGDVGPGRSVFVFANIIWIDDDEAPGPVTMAAAFTRFARAGDRERLLRQLSFGQLARAA